MQRERGRGGERERRSYVIACPLKSQLQLIVDLGKNMNNVQRNPSRVRLPGIIYIYIGGVMLRPGIAEGGSREDGTQGGGWGGREGGREGEGEEGGHEDERTQLDGMGGRGSMSISRVLERSG